MTRPYTQAPALKTMFPVEDDATASAILTIDLGALCANYRLLAALASDSECAAVIKADGYGIGASEAAAALANAGCRTFFVATWQEARQLRQDGCEATLYVLDGLFPGTAAAFSQIDARPVLGSLAEIEEWAEFCADDRRKRAAALHIDTGMNRLGLRAEDVITLSENLSHLHSFEPSLIMSHLACADEPDNPMNEFQRAAFDVLRAKLPAIPACLANSGGVFLGVPHHYDMVRPGFALYGGKAVNDKPNPMQPVVRLQGRIAQIREAQSGESVGYGASCTLTRPTRIATVATGYADGIFRYLGASDGQTGLTGYIGKHKAPILGRVSMDSIMLDVSDMPSELAIRGALVELIGSHMSIDDLARRAGTIGYEVLTSLGQRYKRHYINKNQAAD